MLFICVLGPSIFMIVVGLLWGFWTISTTFNSPYQLMIRIFRLDDMPEYLPKPNLSIIFDKFVNFILSAGMVYMGIKLFVFFDFGLLSVLSLFLR